MKGLFLTELILKFYITLNHFSTNYFNEYLNNYRTKKIIFDKMIAKIILELSDKKQV